MAPYGWPMKIIRLQQRADILTATCFRLWKCLGRDVSIFLAFTDSDQRRLTDSFTVYTLCLYNRVSIYKCASPSCHTICNKRSTSARKFNYFNIRPQRFTLYIRKMYILVVQYMYRYNAHYALRNLLITTTSCSEHWTLCPMCNCVLFYTEYIACKNDLNNNTMIRLGLSCVRRWNSQWLSATHERNYISNTQPVPN